MSISGKTRVCGVIGDPVEHTMSPAMQNAAFQKLGLDFVYAAFTVKGDDLDKAIGGMRALNMRGLNVTILHKVAVMRSLDGIDPMAERIGAVNTIVNDGGFLTGYNTDATGFLQPLLEHGVEPGGKSFAIVGAGGGSRGICSILVERGASLTILNRDPARAADLAGRISKASGGKIAALELSDDNLVKVMKSADVLVNATPVGMSPKADETPVPAALLRPGLLVYDIVYNPVKTKLLKSAESAGCKTICGLDMLVWQGALAFEKWTGKKPPVDIMKAEALRMLEK